MPTPERLALPRAGKAYRVNNFWGILQMPFLALPWQDSSSRWGSSDPPVSIGVSISRFRWGLIIALAPMAATFVLWPLWWLAGCEPAAQAVNCKNAVWYGPVAMAILSIPWLSFLSVPVGFIVMLFGPIPSATPHLEAASAKEKNSIE